MKIFNLKKVLLASLIFVSSLIFLVLGTVKFDAAAETEEILLPVNEYEYFALSSPLSAYCDGEVVAVAESNRLVVFYDGETKILDGRLSLNQVKKYNEDTLIFSDNGHLYFYNFKSGNTKDASDDIPGIGGSYFDYNGSYLITAYSAQMQIYSTVGTVKTFGTIGGIQSLTPVAVNNESVFYVKNNRIYGAKLENLAGDHEVYSEVNPGAMIANDDYIYYTKDGGIRRISINDKTDETLTVEETPFDLGKINSPEGLAFKNDRLLITDRSGSVQEFSVEGTSLKFTGYAIANGKTAYNRLNSVKTLKKFGENLVSINGDKFTIVKLNEDFDGYGEKYFINMFLKNTPDVYAVGNGTVVYSAGNVISAFKINSPEKITEIARVTTVKDINYGNGKFYVISNNGADTTIISIAENDFSTEEKTFRNLTANAVVSDVFNDLYFADDVYIYKNSKDEVLCSRSGVTNFAFDLSGNLFGLKDGKIVRLSGRTFTEVFSTNRGNVNAFALSMDETRVIYSVDSDDLLYQTEDVGNSSIEDAKAESDFALNGNSVVELKIYTVKDGFTAIGAKYADGALTFDGFFEPEPEYAYLGKVDVDSTYNSAEFYALAGNGGIRLIPSPATEEKTVVENAENKEYFVTTKVGTYIVPVITKADEFTIKFSEESLRLEKGTTVYAEYSFTALNVEFIYGRTTINGETVAFYIPKNFTTDKRLKDIEFENYTVEKIKACSVYSDASLTEKIAELSQKTEVRLLSEENGALYISYDSDGATVYGYVSERYLVDESNTVIRNVLAILALFTCLCGTATYFVLRKKI